MRVGTENGEGERDKCYEVSINTLKNFRLHFRQSKCSYFDSHSTENCFQGLNWQLGIVGLIKHLSPSRWPAIIGTNDRLVNLSIYVSIGHNEAMSGCVVWTFYNSLTESGAPQGHARTMNVLISFISDKSSEIANNFPAFPSVYIQSRALVEIKRAIMNDIHFGITLLTRDGISAPSGT